MVLPAGEGRSSADVPINPTPQFLLNEVGYRILDLQMTLDKTLTQGPTQQAIWTNLPGARQGTTPGPNEFVVLHDLEAKVNPPPATAPPAPPTDPVTGLMNSFVAGGIFGAQGYVNQAVMDAAAGLAGGAKGLDALHAAQAAAATPAVTTPAAGLPGSGQPSTGNPTLDQQASQSSDASKMPLRAWLAKWAPILGLAAIGIAAALYGISRASAEKEYNDLNKPGRSSSSRKRRSSKKKKSKPRKKSKTKVKRHHAQGARGKRSKRKKRADLQKEQPERYKGKKGRVADKRRGGGTSTDSLKVRRLRAALKATKGMKDRARANKMARGVRAALKKLHRKA